MGLYGERVGALSVVTTDPKTTKKVESQLKQVGTRLWNVLKGLHLPVNTLACREPQGGGFASSLSFNGSEMSSTFDRSLFNRHVHSSVPQSLLMHPSLHSPILSRVQLALAQQLDPG